MASSRLNERAVMFGVALDASTRVGVRCGIRVTGAMNALPVNRLLVRVVAQPRVHTLSEPASTSSSSDDNAHWESCGPRSFAFHLTALASLSELRTTSRGSTPSHSDWIESGESNDASVDCARMDRVHPPPSVDLPNLFDRRVGAQLLEQKMTVSLTSTGRKGDREAPRPGFTDGLVGDLPSERVEDLPKRV